MTALVLLCLVFLVAAAGALVPAKLPERLQLTAIVCAPLAVLLLFGAVRGFRGWPLPVDRPPAGAVFLAADVVEPKAIYLWLLPEGSERPRAYRLEYSEQLYAEILRAQQGTKRGETITVQRRGRRGTGRNQPPPFALRRYVSPPVRAPAKTHE